MSYHITWEPRGALKTLTGFVTGREFRDSIDDLCMDERFSGIDWLICDLTGVTAHSIDRQDVIEAFAMFVREGSWPVWKATEHVTTLVHPGPQISPH